MNSFYFGISWRGRQIKQIFDRIAWPWCARLPEVDVFSVFSSVRPEHRVWDAGVAGSNPATPTNSLNSLNSKSWLILIRRLMVVASICIISFDCDAQASVPGHARLLSDLELMSIVSCNTNVNHTIMLELANARFGPPVRIELDAYWFKGNGSLYGASVKEFFLTTSHLPLKVGVVFHQSPDKLVKAVEKSRFLGTRLFNQGDHWVGSDGRVLNWHSKKYAKMFC